MQINDPLLQWRQPTEQEKAWIKLMCGSEEKRFGYQQKVLPFVCLGLLMIIASIVIAIISKDIIISVGTFVAAMLVMMFSGQLGHEDGAQKQKATALEQGNYLVAEAQSTLIRRKMYKGNDIGLVDAVLPSGSCVKGLRMPFYCAGPLIYHNSNSVPLLLVQICGDDEVLTIPAR